MLNYHDERHGADKGDGTPVPDRMLERRKAYPSGIDDGLKVYESAGKRNNVTKNDGKKHGDGTNKATHAREDDGSEERDGRDDRTKPIEHGGSIGCCSLEGHLCSRCRKSHADDDHDGSDKDWRKKPVKPSGAHKLDDSRYREEHETSHDNTRERRIEAPRGADNNDGTDEGKGATEVAGDLVPGDKQVADGADARAHDGHVWVEARENRYKNRRAKHAHHMLDAQRDGARDRNPVIDADYFSFVPVHAIDHTPFVQSRKDHRAAWLALSSMLSNII